MAAYLIRRFLLMLLTLFGISVVIFALLRVVPGNIADILFSASGMINPEDKLEIERQLGLDQPIYIQYVRWIVGLLHGDLGYSYVSEKPALDEILPRLPISAKLAGMALCFAVMIGIPLGVISAVRQNRPVDYLARLVSLSGLSLPLFFTGALILYGLVRLFHWLPPLEFVSFREDPVENLKQLIWPALAQAYYISAPITRLTRSQMLEVVRQDYVRTARAKGLAERAGIYRHALRNSLLPVVTFIGWWGGRLLGGLVIMEIIFVVPGMGSALVQAVSQRDYPTVQAMVFVMALVFLAVNLAVDLLYAWLDPRIRYA